MTEPVVEQLDVPPEYGHPIEGAVAVGTPTDETATRLVEEMFANYPQYGRLDPALYRGGVLVLRPSRVLAWTDLLTNATRFRFD